MLPLLLAALAAAGACPDAMGRCVLRPEAGPALRDAASAAAPGLRVDSVAVGRDDAVVTLCGPGSGCFPVRVHGGALPCARPAAAAWCVDVPPAVPGPLAEALVAALGAVSPDEAWTLLEPPGPGPAAALAPGSPPAGSGPDAGPAVPVSMAILAALGGPLAFAAGLGIGLGLRRVRRRRTRSRAGAAVIPAVVTLGAGAGLRVLLPGAGGWDVAGLSILLGLGVATGRAADVRRGVIAAGRLAAIVAVTLIALEPAARLVLPPAPGFTPPGPDDWIPLRTPGNREDQPRWRLADPDAATSMIPDLPAATPRVLHVGNSVVEGAGVRPNEAFPGLLDATDPGSRHVNLGVAGTTADFAWMLVRNWVDAGRAGPLVLYLHPNLQNAMDAPRPWCGGPLVDYAPQGPVRRCPHADPGPLAFQARLVDAPLPLRVAAAAGSSLAGHVLLAFSRMTGVPGTSPQPIDVSLAHAGVLLADLARVLRDAGIPWVVVVLPGRPDLEGDEQEHRLHEAIASMARSSLGPAAVPVLDARAALAAAVARDGSDALFVDRCCHLSPRGHAVVADWLAREVLPLLERAAARP
jgi:hypothetical protein